ncbi:MAG TPA: PilT/PilU family type 4a pilus ATPase [Thermoanaerobaculia bacterium]|nr:PilT/PilU family type 4a pilus ATPase [Thermoanaerobaculia bacterium]
MDGDDLPHFEPVRDAEDGELAAAVPAAAVPPPTAGTPAAAADSLQHLLAEAVRRNASDLLLVPGSPPAVRVDGRLVQLPGAALAADAVSTLFDAHLGARQRQALRDNGAVDFTLRLPRAAGGEAGEGWRFRVNLHRQRGALAAALRALPRRTPTLEELNLPGSLAELVAPTRGLVLVCGATGAGKSSTLAALVGHLNRSRAAHVITIEDPLEYEHASQRCLVEQVEVGTDAPSFAAALRAALRQDPDVILVGEMRDLETVATALTAAETGHLVLATLHTNDVVQAVHRIVDVFPGDQQAQIRQQLALALHAIVCQQLVPRCDRAGRVPALEVLTATYAVRNHIRGEQTQRLYNEVTLGKRHGMVSLEESLARLVKAGVVALEEARIRSGRPEELESLLRGAGGVG